RRTRSGDRGPVRFLDGRACGSADRGRPTDARPEARPRRDGPPRRRGHGAHVARRRAAVRSTRHARRGHVAADHVLAVGQEPGGGRAYVERITARLRDRDALVSAKTIAAHRAAAAGWRRPEAGGLHYLRSIHHPALVVNGSHDIVVPTVNSYDLWQNLPDAQLVLFPDSNHGSHL